MMVGNDCKWDYKHSYEEVNIKNGHVQRVQRAVQGKV